MSNASNGIQWRLVVPFSTAGQKVTPMFTSEGHRGIENVSEANKRNAEASEVQKSIGLKIEFQFFSGTASNSPKFPESHFYYKYKGFWKVSGNVGECRGMFWCQTIIIHSVFARRTMKN